MSKRFLLTALIASGAHAAPIIDPALWRDPYAEEIRDAIAEHLVPMQCQPSPGVLSVYRHPTTGQETLSRNLRDHDCQLRRPDGSAPFNPVSFEIKTTLQPGPQNPDSRYEELALAISLPRGHALTEAGLGAFFDELMQSLLRHHRLSGQPQLDARQSSANGRRLQVSQMIEMHGGQVILIVGLKAFPDSKDPARTNIELTLKWDA